MPLIKRYPNRKLYDTEHSRYVTLDQISEMIRNGDDVKIVTTPSDDLRSYHVSSAKIKRELGWEPRYTVTDAIRELVAAFQAGKVPHSLTDPRYFNIKTMNAWLAAQQKRAA